MTTHAIEHPLPPAGWRSRLASRLAVDFFLPAAAVLVLAATVGVAEMRSVLRESAYERLRAATDVREAQFDRWVREQTNDLRFLVTVPQLQSGVAALASGGAPASATELNAMLRRAVQTQQDLTRIVVLSGVGGRIIAASDPSLVGQYRVSERHFLEGRTHVVVQNVYPAPATGLPTLTIALPIRGADGATIAVLAGDANLARMEEVISERSGLGETGEAYLVDRYHEFVRGNAYDRQRFPRGIHTPTIDRAVGGESGSGVYLNYAGREVVGIYRWMPERQLALFAEMSSEEAFAPARRLVWEMFLFGALAVLTLALGLMFVARHIARPVLQIADAAQAVAGGDLTASAPVRTSDEIGQLAAVFNTMTRRLRAAHGALEAQLRATETAAEATESSRRLLSAVIDHLPALVAVKDLDGRYLITNAAFADFHRVKPDSLLGRSPIEALPQADFNAISASDAKVMETGMTQSAEETHRTGTHERSFIASRFPLLDGDGVLFATGVVATDITERKRMETQILHQQKLEAVGRLAGGVAHDMNNLLTAVRCNAELLLDRMPPGHPDRHPLEEIDRSVRNGSTLTRQLLTFSRAHVVRPSALDVNRILGGMSAMLRRYVGVGIDMQFMLADDLWLVRADEGQMEQVLLNLLSNAHDAMPTGGTATVSTHNVVVGDEEATAIGSLAPGEYVRLAVHDTGTGIDPDLLPLLFEPFFTTKEPGRGTGLGLSTAYAIVQQAEGAITIDSVVGRGTTFNVYLPRHAEEPFVPPAPLPPRVAAGSAEMLLVVDDEVSVRSSLRRMLALHGYRILEAQSGHDALAQIAEHGDSIALVITDVFMPGMHGQELAAQLKQRRPSLPVIFMSGHSVTEVTRRGLLGDDARFLQKPFNRPQVVDLIADVLRKTLLS